MKRKMIGMALVVFLLAGMMVSKVWSAEKPIVWRFQVVHGPNQLEYELFTKTVEDINKAASGRLKIELHPGGAFASSTEAFQSCGDGVFEMHSSWPIYLRGLEFAFQPLSGDNMAMSDTDRMIWLREGGGNELLQKGFDKVNLHLVATQMWPSDVLMAKKGFKKIADMKGRKMRTSAPWIGIQRGIAAITLPLEEVFTAMASGTVDMAEFAYLQYNQGLGITDVVEYAIWPDFWNCHFVETIVVNKRAWAKLPRNLQTIVELGFQAHSLKHWTHAIYESAKVMQTLKKEGKIEFIRIPPDEFITMRKQMYAEEQNRSKKHKGLTKEAYDSIHKFFETYYPYKNKSDWWGSGLTETQQMGYTPGSK